MGVAVDDARHDVFAGAVNQRSTGGRGDSLTDGGDLAVLKKNRSPDDAVGDGQNGGVLDEHRRVGGQGRRQAHESEQAESVHCAGPLPGRAGGSSGSGSNLAPSTNTYLVLVFSAKRSPSVTTRLAILPLSILPIRLLTP